MSQEKTLHILFLASWYPSKKEPTLGIFIKRHAQAAATINKVSVLHAIADNDLKEGEFRIDRKSEGNFHEFIVSYGRSENGIRIIRAWRNWKLLRKHYEFGLEKVMEWNGKPDLIHLNVPWPLGKIARMMSKKLNIPFGVSEHWTGYHPEDGRYTGFLLKRETRLTIKKAAFIAPVSEQLRSAMEAHSLNGNYEIIPNVVDSETFIPANHSNSPTRFIHISSLDDQQKDVSGLLKSFKEAKKEIPELELHIIGGGNDEVAIKRLSNELGLTQRGVEFIGKLQGEELIQELQQADAVILNSRYENQPVVILEALSCGIPVIAPSIAGIPEVINESRGILFNREDSDALKNSMIAFHSKKAQYNKLELRAYCQNTFSYSAVASKLDNLYRKILAAC